MSREKQIRAKKINDEHYTVLVDGENEERVNLDDVHKINSENDQTKRLNNNKKDFQQGKTTCQCSA